MDESTSIDSAVLKAQQRVEDYKRKPKLKNGKQRSTKKVKPYLNVEITVPRLSVKLIRAEDLVGWDKQRGTSDPVCFLLCGVEEYQSTVKSATINPDWNEEYLFGEDQSITMHFLQTENLQVIIRDEDHHQDSSEKIYQDLGQITIPLHELMNKYRRCPPQWHSLQPTENMKAPSGKILCSLRLIGCDDFEFECDTPLPANDSSSNRFLLASPQRQGGSALASPRNITRATPRKMVLDSSRNMTTPHDSFALSPSRRSPNKQHQSLHQHFFPPSPRKIATKYRLRIVARKARSYHKLDRNDHLIGEFLCGKEKFKTTSCPHTSSQGWDEQIEFGNAESIEKQNHVLVRVRVQKHGLKCFADLGEVSIPLSKLLSGKSQLQTERWYPISLEQKVTGEIRLHIEVDLPESIEQIDFDHKFIPVVLQMEDSKSPLPLNVKDDDSSPSLELAIVQGRDLTCWDKLNNQETNAFCTIAYQGEKVRTSISKETNHPKWNQKFRFPLSSSLGSVRITVHDQEIRDGILTIQDLGEIVLPLEWNQAGLEQIGWFELAQQQLQSSTSLVGANAYCRGELKLSILIRGTSKPISDNVVESATDIKDQKINHPNPSSPITRSRKAKPQQWQSNQTSKESEKDRLEQMNQMVGKLDDKDTQSIAMKYLWEVIPLIKPQSVSRVFKILAREKNPPRPTTRKCILKLIGLLCQHHAHSIVASANNPTLLSRIIQYVIQRIKDQEFMIHEMCIESVRTIAERILPPFAVQEKFPIAMMVNPFLDLLHGSIQDTERRIAGQCIGVILHPITATPKELRIQYSVTPLSEEMVKTILRNCGIPNSSLVNGRFLFQSKTDNSSQILILRGSNDQVREWTSRLQSSSERPSDWKILRTRVNIKEGSDQEDQYGDEDMLNESCVLSAHYKSLLSEFHDLLQEFMVCLGTKAHSKIEAQLLIMAECAEATKNAPTADITHAFAQSWISHLKPIFILCHSVLHQLPGKNAWKAQIQALRLVQALVQIIDDELQTRMGLFRQLIFSIASEGCTVRYKVVRDRAVELLQLLKQKFGESPVLDERNSLDYGLDSEHTFEMMDEDERASSSDLRSISRSGSNLELPVQEDEDDDKEEKWDDRDEINPQLINESSFSSELEQEEKKDPLSNMDTLNLLPPSRQKATRRQTEQHIHYPPRSGLSKSKSKPSLDSTIETNNIDFQAEMLASKNLKIEQLKNELEQKNKKHVFENSAATRPSGRRHSVLAGAIPTDRPSFRRRASQGHVAMSPKDGFDFQHEIVQSQNSIDVPSQLEHSSSRTSLKSNQTSSSRCPSTIVELSEYGAEDEAALRKKKKDHHQHQYLGGIQEALKEGHVDNAFRIALKSQDKTLLLQLMALTRPCVAQLSRTTQNVLFASLLRMNPRGTNVLLQILPWIANAIEDKQLSTLDPRVVHELERKLYDVSAEPTNQGVKAAKLYAHIRAFHQIL